MANIINLGEKNSIFNHFISELRNVEVQNDRMRFRKNLERIGEICAYEISKTLDYKNVEITTPLGVADLQLMVEQPVLVTILRAGIPMHQGMLNFFDKADCGFIAAYRKYDKNEDFEIRVEYCSAPNLDNRILIMCDPMLATGASIVKSIKDLLHKDMVPKQIHIVATIASVEGIEYICKNLSLQNVTIWVGAIDDELTARAYIVPGLGDAGDLAYGLKI